MDLTENLEREPTREELAAALGVEVAELSAYQDHAQLRTLISFDEPSANGEDTLPLAERLADPAAKRPDAGMVSAEDRRMMVKCLAALPAAQATVITLHYLRNVPLRQVARLLKVTPPRVSQLHHQALARLRQAWPRSQAV